MHNVYEGETHYMKKQGRQYIIVQELVAEGGGWGSPKWIKKGNRDMEKSEKGEFTFKTPNEDFNYSLSELMERVPLKP